MPSSSKSDQAAVSEKTALSFVSDPACRRYSSLERMLGYIVFEGHGFRIGLELTCCILLHALLQSVVPWEKLQFDRQWASLYSWFACCFLVLVLDLKVLSRSAHGFRRAYLLGLHGEYESALRLLDAVGPKSRCLVRLPLHLYHLYRAELAAHQGQSTEVSLALARAEESGVARDRLLFHKLQLMRLIGEVETCHHLLGAIAGELGESAAVSLEQARTFASRREEWPKVKQAARRAKQLPDAPHVSGERCHRLAAAYEAVAMLWTGEAEAGLAQLNYEIEMLRRSMCYADALRPIFAQLLLERSLYLATHKEPTTAVYDYAFSRSLCVQEEFAEISERIRTELADRYAIALA